MKNIWIPKFTERTIFISTAIFIGLIMSVLSFDYGPLEDARIHMEHGERILDYFKEINEVAALNPILDDGTLIDVGKSKEAEYKGMNGFGGFFDLLSSFLYQYFDFLGDNYSFKNFLNAIFGFLLFLFCGLLGKELGGWRVGLLTLIFVVLMPVIFGYSMNNPKDIPAAAFYMFSLFHIVKLLKELPVVTIRRAFFLIVNISLLINIRLIGLIVIGYLLLAVFSWWVLENYEKGFKNVHLKETLLLIIKIVMICFFAYISVSFLWPYAQKDPLLNPIKVFKAAKDFRGFENLQLFEGIWKSSFDVPWYYAIKNLFIITMPLHAFIGFFLIPLLYLKNTKQNILYVSIVLFASVFPMILVIIGKPNSHDGSRQFMFSVLPVVILSAVSWYKLFTILSAKNRVRVAFGGLIFLMLQPLYSMIRDHPMQALYFSPIIGGVSGAYGNYEIDYYGVGIRPAINWLESNVGNSENPPRVRMYYGSQTKITTFLDKTDKLTHALTRRDSPDWDYSIIMLAEGKYKQDLDVNWSPDNTVHEIKIDDVSICFIVKSDYNEDNHIAKLEKDLIKVPSASGYIKLSLLYYNKNDNLKSIEASKKAISIDADNSIAYNNLCSAYNRLKVYDLAKLACEKALSINAEFVLAKNNLKASVKGLEKISNKKLTKNEYLNISFYYYRLGFYERCIKTSEELLMIDPKNVVALNNICSSYNAMKKYDIAIGFCNKALELNPNFERAKNNLKWAQESLKKK